MMGKITSNILILVKCRNHQRQFVQTEMEGKGWAEGDTGGGGRRARGGGCTHTVVSGRNEHPPRLLYKLPNGSI